MSMSQLRKNAIAFLGKRFPASPVNSQENSLMDLEGKVISKVWPMVALHSQSGMKQRAIAIEDLGSKGELIAIAKGIKSIFDEMDRSLYVKMGNVNPTGHWIDTVQMVFAPIVIIYTNKSFVSMQEVIEIFGAEKILVDVVDESKIHKTLFISYGGPDEDIVRQLNSKIKAIGVITWFFPDDAELGSKLHRVMHDGINTHDRVLLVCSKSSLTRYGVLNEIERVLEREAKEGGSEILIPVTIDDYVYSDWAPKRPDIASQVRSRVIAKIETTGNNLDKSIDKITKVLIK